MDAPLLELVTALPRTTPPSEAQRTALSVLADLWLQQDRVLGLVLAERLQGTLDPERCEELGVDPWLARCDLRALALLAPEVPALVAAVDDVERSVRLLSWLLSAPAGRPLHARVAAHLEAMLLAVEQRALTVRPLNGGCYALSNGWQVDVFVRVHSFWRVDAMRSPEGFEVLLIDYDDGPLARLGAYEPPTDVEEEVYGVGLRSERGRR